MSQQQTLTVKQLITALLECDLDDLVSFLDTEVGATFNIGFVNKCITEETVFLLEKPVKLNSDTLKILEQAEHFAKTEWVD